MFSSKYPTIEKINDGKKVRCRLTGHEMKADGTIIEAYVNGRKYRRALAQQDSDYEQYQPHIIQSREHQNQLFCKLTLRHLNKEADHVKRHVNGKRFKRALKKWHECQEKGVPFKPRGGNKPRAQQEERGSFEHSDENESVFSDQSDLYPESDSGDNSPPKLPVHSKTTKSNEQKLEKSSRKVKNPHPNRENENDEFEDLSDNEDMKPKKRKTNGNNASSKKKKKRKNE